MRLILTLLLTVLLIGGIWSFVAYEPFLLGPSPDGYNWWWPAEMTSYGGPVDFLFWMIAWMILPFFLLTMGGLIYIVFRYSAKREDKADFSHGNHKLELLWTGVPACLLLVIAFSQMNAWADIKFAGATKDQPIYAEIWASQFDWRFRYPGPDGLFATDDDFETVYELVVPLMESVEKQEDRKLVFHLRSRDVLHSFFVPHLRLKQDAVPGMTIPIWFDIEMDDYVQIFPERDENGEPVTGADGELQPAAESSFDVICAELCGWGHYKMSGRVRVLNEERYAEWQAEMVANKYGNQ